MNERKPDPDVAIIGAGPIGLSAAYYCGTRGLKPILIETLGELGGQCQILYPEKLIYDVASQTPLTGAALTSKLKEQLKQVDYLERLETSVTMIREKRDQEEKFWELETNQGEKILVRAIIIAIGKGAFKPRKLKVPGEELENVFYTVKEKELFKNKRLMVVGGGDSAFDWSLELKDLAQSLVQIHRTDRYRAHESSVNQLKEASKTGQVEMLPFYEVQEIFGEKGKVKKVKIFNNKNQDQREFEIDSLIISTGFLTNLGNLSDWGLKIDSSNKILVNSEAGFSTNLAGVFAIGDIAHFPGKVELIITGFGEAATAAYYAYKHIRGNVRGAAWCAGLPR